MGRNGIAWFLLSVGVGAGAARAMPVTPPTGLRSPQVHVNGGVLQAYMNGVGESINVQTDQRDAQLLRPSTSSNSTYSLQFEFVGPPGNILGIYDGHSLPGTLMPVFPAVATNLWFAGVSWRTAPARVVISLFDNTAAFIGQTTFLGGDRNAIGLYLTTPHATYFTQDPLNPNHEPRALFYSATGVNAGSWWVAWEDGDAPANNDFDDCVVFIEAGSTGVVPVVRTTWGELKSRFR